MANKTFNTRIISKHDSPENWALATTFVPMEGEIIVYEPNGTTQEKPKIKVGDGSTVVGSLPFVGSEDSVFWEGTEGAKVNAKASGTAVDLYTKSEVDDKISWGGDAGASVNFATAASGSTQVYTKDEVDEMFDTVESGTLTFTGLSGATSITGTWKKVGRIASFDISASFSSLASGGSASASVSVPFNFATTRGVGWANNNCIICQMQESSMFIRNCGSSAVSSAGFVMTALVLD